MKVKYTRRSLDDIEIWAYTDRLSYISGSIISFFVSTNAPTYSVEISRIGAQREVVYFQSGFVGAQYDIPDTANECGCNWPVAFCETIPSHWRSGYYQVIFVAHHSGRQSQAYEHFFVLRCSGSSERSKILFVLSTNTYIAYNSWGGGNLYMNLDRQSEPSNRASILRPIEPGMLTRPSELRVPHILLPKFGTGNVPTYPSIEWYLTNGYDPWGGSAGWGGWECHCAKWLEDNGYIVDYAINSDIDNHPELLEQYKLLLSIGHDEYWSWVQRDVVENYIENGGNVAFFGGNSVFWQVRWEDDGQTMVCYKYDYYNDPILDTDDKHLLTSIWSDPIIGRPENFLTGLSFTRGGYARLGAAVPHGSGKYTVYRPDHWVFEGTGLEYGDSLGGDYVLVGYECDGCQLEMHNNLPVPTGLDGTPLNLIVLAISPASLAERLDRYPTAINGEDELDFCTERLFGSVNRGEKEKLMYGNAIMSIFERGGKVFNAGCTEWVFGLKYQDRYVERITANVLNKLTE